MGELLADVTGHAKNQKVSEKVLHGCRVSYTLLCWIDLPWNTEAADFLLGFSIHSFNLSIFDDLSENLSTAKFTIFRFTRDSSVISRYE